MNNNNKKETVKNSKKAKGLSTQRYVHLSEVHDDTLVLKSGGLRTILEVSSINFNLKSEAEQQSIISGYQRFLNALNFPVQIQVKSRKLDIDLYIDSLRMKMKALTNELLRKQMAEYIEYVSKLVEYSDIMEKKFYVVVPVDPERAKPKGVFDNFLKYIKPDDTVMEIIKRKKEFKNLKKEMDSRVGTVKAALENCGLSTRQLKTQEIIELFYQSYNPTLSRTQKMAPVEELSVEGSSRIDG